uniref:Transcriptional regulator n=1 Tax=Thermosporothrix sp. COM3 TaxID=2490863 RepID=A0A455SHW6_9CHLR|nr:transcriptional regulator [Thermosporothrix sp. COM3]
MNEAQRRAELSHFLRTRRERLSPEQFQLPKGGKRRRTPGLRREELAMLAGVGLTWYVKLEQGQDIQVSAQVLESLARTLHLTPDERTYLFLLARAHPPMPLHTSHPELSDKVQTFLDDLHPSPAFVMNDRLDIVGWNHAATRVFIDFAALSTWERHFVWLLFTNEAMRRLYVHWELVAQRALGLFRAAGGLHAGEGWFIERREKLIEASEEFRAWWPRHDVGEEHLKRKELCHPTAGLLTFQALMLQVAEDPGLTISAYTPLPVGNTCQKLEELVNASHLS